MIGLELSLWNSWEGEIGTSVTNSFMGAFDRRELSHSQKQGVITLLYKGNELDKEDDVNGKRPIT